MTSIIEQAIAALSVGSLYAVMALGIAVVFGIMRLINFAYGELIMVGGYFLTWGVIAGTPLFLTAVATLAVVTIVALAQERVAFRPLRGAPPATLMVTSFAVSFLLQSVAVMVSGARPRGVQSPFGAFDVYVVGVVRVSKIDLITIGTAAGLLVALVIFLKRTNLGVEMRASAHDFEMARLLGVRANRVVAAGFAISGICAGAVTLLLASRTGSVSPTMGLGPTLIAFVATVLGGLGSLGGAALGGLVLGALEVGAQAVLPTNVTAFRGAVNFGVVFILLLLRPQGLLGDRVAK